MKNIKKYTEFLNENINHDLFVWNNWYENNEDGRAWDVFNKLSDGDIEGTIDLIKWILSDLYNEGELSQEPTIELVNKIMDLDEFDPERAQDNKPSANWPYDEEELQENLNENISQNDGEELIRKWNKYMSLVEIIDGILSEQGELSSSFWQSNVEADLNQLTSTENVNPNYIKDNYELIKKNFEEIMDGLEGWEINNDINKFGSLRGINKNLFK